MPARVSPRNVPTSATVSSVGVRRSANQRARSSSTRPTDEASGPVSSRPTPTTAAQSSSQVPASTPAVRRVEGGAWPAVMPVSVAAVRPRSTTDPPHRPPARWSRSPSA